MDKLGELIRGACEHPAMYVGTVNYWRVVCWIDGYAVGRFDAGDNTARSAMQDFRTFLIRKYHRGTNRYWYHIIDIMTPDCDDEEKLARFRDDFGEFTNVLTRMAIETE